MRKYISEFIGTMVLVIFGCGSAVAANTALAGSAALNILLISFAFGLAVVAMAYSIGNISGCHINPAVSFGMFISGRMKFSDFIGYVVSQVLGGVAGAALLSVILKAANITGALGANGFGDQSMLGITMWGAILVEIVLTFVFVLAVLGATHKESNSSVAGLVIGLTLVLVHILGIPFTGTSVNPARSFGPALILGGTALKQVWVFIVAPLVGSFIAAVTYRFLGKKVK